MSTHAPQMFRFSTALSLGLGWLLSGCGLATVDGGAEPSSDETVGSDEAALYQDWAPAPQEELYVRGALPLHFCGDGVVATNEECDDGGHAAGDGCNTNCRIEPGYACDGSPSACADIDECHGGTVAVCGPHASCRNEPGTYSCECELGFESNGTVCTDVDECALGLDTCSANGFCVNELGGYGCGCQAGFEGDGVTCTDVDECAEPARCGEGGLCVNHQGGYKCDCESGYENVNGRCADIDECSTGAAECPDKSTCNNRPGSFECVCLDGYKDDGTACVYVGND